MKMTYLKLIAKRRLMNDTLRCFFVSILPFFTFSLCIVFNYYLPFFLKKTSGNKDIFLNVVISIFSIVISFCFWKCVCLMKEKFFFMKTVYKKVKFFKVVRSIKLNRYITYLKVSVLRMLLAVSWSAVYFLPCGIVALLLIYSYRYENYGENVLLTLFVSSVMLFLVGAFHFFVTLKRYSMCEFIILTDKQKNPLKIMAESIKLMENHSINYSLYCLSFTGWVLSCIFLVPLFYVLPFVNMSKWCYMEKIRKQENTVNENEKPIIFYIQKRKKA